MTYPSWGTVTGPLSRVLDVPVVLTLFSVVNYVFPHLGVWDDDDEERRTHSACGYCDAVDGSGEHTALLGLE